MSPVSRSVPEILKALKSKGSPRNVAGMARYGIVAKKAYGVSAPDLMAVARTIGKNHVLARRLWATGVFDARILAAFVEQPELVTRNQMDQWASEFDNWAICDGVCLHLFRKTPFAYGKARTWSSRPEEFVRRAGFTMMAVLTVHDKKAPQEAFSKLLPLIRQRATDERTYVKKAVNWALRQIGKRSLELNRQAIRTAGELLQMDSPAARWIARDALRELKSPATIKRLRLKNVRKGQRPRARRLRRS
jgi:3-methyladenine DNA glycosylase AlkD